MPKLPAVETDPRVLATRLRQTRANMLGTDDDQHYWDCHDAAAALERLVLTDAEREAIAEAICDQESYLADCRNFHDPDGEKRAAQIGDTLRGLLARMGENDG